MVYSKFVCWVAAKQIPSKYDAFGINGYSASRRRFVGNSDFSHLKLLTCSCDHHDHSQSLVFIMENYYTVSKNKLILTNYDSYYDSVLTLHCEDGRVDL